MARATEVARNFLAVTPHDTSKLSKGSADGFYIGTGGTIVLEGEDGETVSFVAQSGGTIPAGSLRVYATGTTASDIVAMYV
jgi:hypothetical protein